jgi:hypothetical protein
VINKLKKSVAVLYSKAKLKMQLKIFSFFLLLLTYSFAIMAQTDDPLNNRDAGEGNCVDGWKCSDLNDDGQCYQFTKC